MRLLVVVLLVTVSFQSLLAGSTYKVLAAMGTSMAQRGADPDEYVKVVSGLDIYANDVIIITGSLNYISLVSSDGRMIELEKGGVYHMNELLKRNSGQSPFLAKYYVDVLVQNVETKIDSALRYEAYINPVQRSISSSKIKIKSPSITKVFSENIRFNWTADSEIQSFIATIKDVYGEKMFTQSTDSNSIEIDFSKLYLLPGQVYELSVTDANNRLFTSNPISLRVPSRSELAKYSTELEMLASEIPENSALGDLVLATYYENNGLFLNALMEYEEAVEKQQDIVEYQNAYLLFLYRIGVDYSM